MSENLIGVTEKMNLKEFGNNLIEMCKDLRYIGDQIRKRLKIPLNAYAESARTKSDTEDLCQIVGNVLEAARLNIDGGIETLREGIRNTEHNAVLKEVYTKFDKYLDCHNVDRNDNIKSTDVEHAPNMQSCNTAPNNSDKSTSNEEFVYDDQLEREIKEEKAKSTTADQLEDVLQSSTETEQSSTETEQSSTITNAQENRNKRTAERISHDDPIGKVHPKKRATRNEECSQKIDIEQPSDDPNCETVEEPNHEVQDLPDHLKPEISEDIELPPPGDTNLETVEAPNHNVEDLADHLKPEISEDTLEDLEDIEVNGLSNNNRNKKKSNSNSAETILDLPSSPKAESFCIDIEEHDLTEYKKVESLDTIIASPPILDSLPRPESPSNKSVFDESTIPDNSPLSQDLGSEDFMANSDTGRQSQYNSESENDDVSNSESDDTFRISKTPINKIPRKTSKLNKSKTDQPATNEDIFEEITCDVDTNKNTSENKSKQDSGSAPEELSNKTIEADTCNLDTNKNTSENRDRDPVVEQLPNEVVKESTCDVDTNKNTSENKSEQDKNFDEISNEIVEGNICDVDNRDSVVEERSNTILEKNDEPYIEGKDPPSNTSEPGISSELDQDLHILHEKPNEEDNVNDLPDIPTDQPWSIELTKEKVDKDVNKQLKVNGNNLDVTPDNVLQVLNGSELSHGNADTAKRKVFEDDQGITADHTFISEGYENECEDNSKEDNTNRLSNDTEEADKESVCSFTFDIQEDYEHMVLATQIDTCPSDEDTCETLCGSYSSEGTIIDEPLDTPNINDINACESDGIRLARSKPARKLSSDVDPLDSIDVIGGDSDIVSRKRPRKLSTESESNGDDSDAQSETSIQIKKSTKKLESDLSDDENCNNVDVSQNEHPISSDKNNPTDVQSERSIQIKKSSRKLDSDVSDSESNHKEPKGSELNDNSKNCTPASVNDFENTVGLSHISRSTNSDNEKNENVPKVSIEDSIISDCESNSGSSVAGDHNIIDDIYSSEDDAFIEVSPHKVLNEGAESTNDETKDIAIKEETKTDDDNTIKEPSNKDSLNELLDEYFNAKEQIKSAQNTVSDNKVDEPPVTLDNDSLSIKCSQVIPEEKVEIDCEKNKDDLLTLLDQYSKDIESEMNKTNLLELLEEREKSSNGNDEYEFKLPDSELLYDVATVASVKDELPLEMSSQIEAEKIFQKLLVDDSDISDISDSEDDSSSINIEETDLGSDSSTEDLFDEYKDMYGLKKLSVYIERLKLDKDMLEDAKLNIGENNEADSDIDRKVELLY